MNTIPDTIHGYRVVYSPFLTVSGEPYEVKRTFKERWFSLPWKPFKKVKLITTQVPSREVIRNNGVLYAHPVMKSEFDNITRR